MAYQYSKLGIKESSQYQGLPELFYQTYGAGHFIGLLMDGESLIDFERDNLHRESERRFADIYLKSSYNERGELSKVTSPSYIHNFLNREYLYDKAGQLTTALTGQGEIKYRYDLRGRLTEAESYDFTQQYHYDFAGNLLPEAITPEAQLNNPYLADLDVGNRLESDNDFDYFYDDFGNLVRKYSKDLEESHYYQYDNQHRLIHYDRFTKNDKTIETDYRYDPLGRRITKSSQKMLHGKVQPIETHWYGWDGDKLVTTELKESRVHTLYDPTSFTPLIRLEQALPIPEKIKPLGDIMEAETEMSLPKIVKDRFNRLEKEINEDNLTEEMQIWLKQMGMTKESIKADFIPAKPEKQKLTKHYYHTDQIGTPLALITEKGEKAWEIITDPYGRRVREENPNKLYQPIRMQGQHYDAESNLHYNRHRYYDPNIGRYISQDPIGLQGGINNYVYPLNPNQVVDPLGLVAPAIFWGIGIVLGVGGGAIVTSPGVDEVGGIDLKPDPTIPVLIILGPTILWDKLFSGSEVRDKTCTDSTRRKGRWSCTATCNIQVIDHNLDGKIPDRAFGSASGKTEVEACAEAKRVATQSVPRGAYPRHCQCKCSKK